LFCSILRFAHVGLSLLSLVDSQVIFTNKLTGSKLLIFLDHPELQLDTNLVENDIRPFVIGRKNWLFSGCPQGATESAGFYSLIQNAKISGIHPYAYLRDLFKSWERDPRSLSYEDLPQSGTTVVR
ncbi:transposase, partial [Leptospira santarosai]|uniref:IS66 family transposase n=1 Tax=Leptospira santarosai TaxID=28183 RepID=UPI0024AF612B